jgi:hypothetical protein
MTAINQAVLLLGTFDVDGKESKVDVRRADASAMNALAQTLDDHNDNR